MIYLAEDSADDEALMLRALEDRGAGPVTVMRDGAEVLARLLAPGAALPDVLILDLELPVMKGLDVLRRLRAERQTRHLPVVILTSSIESADVERSYELGANSFVRKPVDPRQFLETVREIARYWGELNRGIRA